MKLFTLPFGVELFPINATARSPRPNSSIIPPIVASSEQTLVVKKAHGAQNSASDGMGLRNTRHARRIGLGVVVAVMTYSSEYVLAICVL